MAEKEYIERGVAIEFVKRYSPTVDGFTTLQCVENAIKEIPAADVTEVRHGEWVKHDELKDDFYHHRCSICKEDAPFHYVETEDYDEGMDGEFYFIGMRITNIVEHLTNYCPNCGAKMDGERKEQK